MIKKTDLSVCVFFAAIVCVLYLPVFRGGFWAMNSSDGLHLHVPRAASFAKTVLSGGYPSWNPLQNLGQPCADGVNPFFHPAHFLYFFLPPEAAHTIEILLGLFLIFLGMYAFLMHLGAGTPASLIGALCYGFSGPVFFLHSYHLGYPAVLLLPWGLLFFHMYASTGLKGYGVLSVIACLFLIHGADADSAAYVFAAYAADRYICRPRSGRKRYYFLWAGIGALSVLSAAAVYAPFLEWARLSSRAYHSYGSTIVPSAANVLCAAVTGSWFKEYAYDPAYFFLGAGLIVLAAIGIRRVSVDSYARRFFLCAAVCPVYFVCVCVLYKWGVLKQLSADPWRPMFVFCFGLSLLSAEGSRTILSLLRPKPLAWLVLCGVVISSGAPAMARVSIRPSCGWNHTDDNLVIQPPLLQCPSAMMNMPYYARLASAAGSGRTVVFGGTDNLTEIAGLRTFINYAPVYNLRFEQALRSDGLIEENGIQPYWMRLEDPDPRRLGIYGVKFLVAFGDANGRVSGIAGWVYRGDLSWEGHAVYENIFYRGRAYLVDDDNVFAGTADIAADDPDRVEISLRPGMKGRLVLSDLAFPGWQAEIDGTPAVSMTFHGCLRSVRIGPGDRRVTWRYVPRMLPLAAGVSASALVALIAAVIFII